MLPFYISHWRLWRPAITMLLRLKWFFISILLVYYFFTPELPIDANNYFSFLAALFPAVFRISVLIAILLAVNLFIQTTSKEQILAALLWFFSPLQNLKLDVHRIALRAVLTLEYIEILTLRLTQFKERKEVSIEHNVTIQYHSPVQLINNFLNQKKKAFYHLINQSGIILRDILLEAEKTSGKHYEINCLKGPVLVQYLIPVFIFFMLLLTL